MLKRGHISREHGQVVVIFALLLPMILALCGVVIGLGNWFVHGKHLQTKADAGAIAGGGEFQFPCFAGVDAIDQRIANLARQYAGPVTAPPVASPNPGFNPQVGHVEESEVHAVLTARSGTTMTPTRDRRKISTAATAPPLIASRSSSLRTTRSRSPVSYRCSPISSGRQQSSCSRRMG